MSEFGGGGGGAAAPPKADAPPRPTIALPPRSSYENLFRGSVSGSGGGAADASPGPMTLVSSFFAEYPDNDCNSFSQLLAGAMSPIAPVAAPVERSDSAGGDGGGFVRQPMNLAAPSPLPSPYFTVPPGLSPTGLLNSPGFFSPLQGHFGMSHQQALAQVTAQAAHSHAHMQIQTEYPSSLAAATTSTRTQATGSASNMALLQQMPLHTSNVNNTTMPSAQVAIQGTQSYSHMHIQAEYPSSLVATTMTQPTSSASNVTLLQQMQLQTSNADNTESSEGSHFDRKSQPTAPVVDKPADDGYNWRKYGQKQVKGSEYPRSYYKCTHPSCPVKKKVERSLDGHVTEIVYKGQHSHQKPVSNRRGKEGGSLPSGSLELNSNPDFPANSDKLLHGVPANFSRSSDTMAAPAISKRERESGYGTSEQLSGSSDGEEVGDAEVRADEGDNKEANLKRRNIDTRVAESTSHKTVTEPRIIVQTTSEVDLLDDGYRWRKYGQKVVKGNPHPRSYYKCTTVGCTVRKHVERASTDPKAVVTTYEGKHNHDVPVARSSSHSTANTVASSTQRRAQYSMPNNQPLHSGTDMRNNVQQPVSVLRLKEEGDA